jgi:hypothetical protein
MCNVQGGNDYVIREKGSTTSPKRCTILVKGDGILPNPNILKGCNVQGMGFMPSK